MTDQTSPVTETAEYVKGICKSLRDPGTAFVSHKKAADLIEALYLMTLGHAQTPADQLTRQPDLSDGSRYSNNDIACRMWQTFNVTGDRWFKYAAQRLQGVSASPDTSTDREGK